MEEKESMLVDTKSNLQGPIKITTAFYSMQKLNPIFQEAKDFGKHLKAIAAFVAKVVAWGHNKPLSSN